jgi:hypothetical protein
MKETLPLLQHKNKLKTHPGWWPMSVIPALRRLRRDDSRPSWVVVKPSLKNKTNKQNLPTFSPFKNHILGKMF